MFLGLLNFSRYLESNVCHQIMRNAKLDLHLLT